MTVGAYLRAWIRRALSGTGGTVSTLATFAGVAAVLIAARIPATQTWVTDQVLLVGGLVVCVFGWRLVLAPYWLHRDLGRKYAQLRAVYEALSAPRVILVPTFEPQRRPFWIPEERQLRVGVRNEGQVAAEHVQVKLIEILPSSPLPGDPLPSRLGHKGGGTDSVVIHPRDEELFDVISDVSVSDARRREFTASPLLFVTSSGPHTVEMHLDPGGRFKFDVEPDRAYTFVMQVSAANAVPVAAVMVVRHTSDGMLDASMAVRDSSLDEAAAGA